MPHDFDPAKAGKGKKAQDAAQDAALDSQGGAYKDRLEYNDLSGMKFFPADDEAEAE